MNKTVALVGGHPGTRKAAPWGDTAVDIWVWNEGAMNAPRATAALQVHGPRWLTDPAHPDFLAWARKPHGFPIYMQAADQSIPDATPYPLEDALALCPDVRMFSCSAAWAFALAILKGYESIHLYGVEADHHTEYVHQGEAIAFWVGFAKGRGIDVQVHSAARVFQKPLYGFEEREQTSMNLHIVQRIRLIDLLPPVGDVLTLRTLRGLREALAFTEEEGLTWNVRKSPDGLQLLWDADPGRDYTFSEAERRVLIDAFSVANEKKLVPMELLDVYEALIANQ